MFLGVHQDQPKTHLLQLVFVQLQCSPCHPLNLVILTTPNVLLIMILLLKISQALYTSQELSFLMHYVCILINRIKKNLQITISIIIVWKAHIVIYKLQIYRKAGSPYQSVLPCLSSEELSGGYTMGYGSTQTNACVVSNSKFWYFM